MAKVHLNAIVKGITGRIGALVFYEWDGDTFVRPQVRQRDPKTPLQLDLRDAFSRAVHAWQALPEAEKAQWNRRASKRRTTGYHAYLSAYMRNRWDRAEAVRPHAVAMTVPAYHDIIPKNAVKRPSSRYAAPVDLRCPFVPPSLPLSDAFLSALSGG
jgi:hypothetical protein